MTPATRARLQGLVETLKNAVLLAVVNIDCERNGLTADGNVRERLVRAANEADDQLAACLAAEGEDEKEAPAPALKCYNCKQSVPSPDDAKVLCARCSTLYAFVDGQMMAKRQR